MFSSSRRSSVANGLNANHRNISVQDFNRVIELLADNRQNTAAVARPSECEEWKYLRPSAVSEVAAGCADGTDETTLQGRVWVPDTEDGFIEARILHEGLNEVALSTKKGDVEMDVDQLEVMNPGVFDCCEDMSRLTHLNEATVLHNLKQRYRLNLTHTYSGLFCITINPWRWLPIYSANIVRLYKGQNITDMPPHIYAIADYAYNSMLHGQKDQSILITGESGAGKTENTKKIMQYFAVIAASRSVDGGVGDGGSRLEEQIMESNPVLEAFGNAKTVHNDNSSRFGKFTRINFDTEGKVAAAEFESYMLEKSRVTAQSNAERSYHIFYQLLSGALPDQLTESLHLEGSSKDYRFIQSGLSEVDTIDDVKEMNHTLRALDILGFKADEKLGLLELTASVLHLGQMKFAQRSAGDQAFPDGTAEAKLACDLLKLNVHKLLDSLTDPTVRVGDELVKQSRNLNQVLYTVGAVSKALYERVFKWLVKRCNTTLSLQSGKTKRYIGVLDIAGFEIFQVNSFEQLCINYTNERLQQFFNHRMFVQEQEEYRNEDIPWESIDFGLDLQPTIDLIEKPLGILSLLDEECIVPKGSDKGLVDKLHKAYLGKNPIFSKPKHSKRFGVKGHFALDHYAGTVNYNVDGWLDKNRDPLNECVIKVFLESENPRLRELWSDMANLQKNNNSNSYGKRKQSMAFLTATSIYKDQLNNLMAALNATQPHFIRCIVPNYERKPGRIDGQLVLHQLRCNGVLEGIRICRKGYPNRLLYEDFTERYRIISPEACGLFRDPQESTLDLCEMAGLERVKDFELGITKVFCRAGILGRMEHLRTEGIARMVTGMQARIRGFLEEKEAKNKLSYNASCLIIQENVREWISVKKWPWFILMTSFRPLLRKPLEELEEAKKAAEVERDALQQRLQAKGIENETLMGEIRVLKDEAVRMLESMENQKFELAGAKEERDRQISLVQRLHSQKDETEKESLCLRSDLNSEVDKSKQLANQNAKLQMTIKQLQHDLARERKSREEFEFAQSRLNSEIRSWELKTREIESDKSRLDAEIRNKDAEIKSMNSKMGEHKDIVDKLQAIIKEQRDTIEKLEKELQEERMLRRKAEGVRDGLQNELAESLSKLAKIEKSLSNQLDLNSMKDHEIQRLQMQLDDASNKTDTTLIEMRKIHSIALKQLQEQLEAMHKKSIKLESQNQQLEAKLEQDMWINDPARLRPQVGYRPRRSSSTVDTLKLQMEMTRSFTSTRNRSTSDFLTRRIDELERENKELQREKSMLKREIEASKKSLQDETAEKDRLFKICKAQKFEITDLQKNLDKVETKAEDLNRQLKRTQSEVLNWRTRSDRQLLEKDNELETTKRRLQDKIDKASAGSFGSANRFATLENDRSELQQELAEAQGELRRQQGIIMTLEKMQQSQEKALDNWGSSFKGVTNEVEGLRQDNHKLKSQALKLETEITELKEENSSLRNTSSVSKLETNLEEAKVSNRRLKEKLEAAEKFRDEVDALQKENNSLSREVDSLRMDHDDFKDMTKKNFAKKEKEIEKLRAEKAELTEEFEKLRNEVSSAQDQFAESYEENFGQIQELRLENENLRGELQLHQETGSRNDLEEKIAQISEHHQNLQAKVEQKSEKIRHLLSENESLKEQLSTYGLLETEFDELRSVNATLKEEISSLKAGTKTVDTPIGIEIYQRSPTATELSSIPEEPIIDDPQRPGSAGEMSKDSDNIDYDRLTETNSRLELHIQNLIAQMNQDREEMQRLRDENTQYKDELDGAKCELDMIHERYVAVEAKIKAENESGMISMESSYVEPARPCRRCSLASIDYISSNGIDSDNESTVEAVVTLPMFGKLPNEAEMESSGYETLV